MPSRTAESDHAARLAARLGLREARCRQGDDWPFVRKDRVAFVHVPKTGGTSFDSYLRTFFAVGEILPLPLQLRAPDRWPAEDCARYRYLHNEGPKSVLTRRVPNAHLVTLLRDPVRRIISRYWHHRGPADPTDQPPDRAEQRKRVRDIVRRLPLAEWLRLPSQEGGYRRNTYVAKFSDSPAPMLDLDAATLERLLEEAKRSLQEEFAFVGITEEYARSKTLFCRTFGLPAHYSHGEERFNVSKFTEARKDVDAETHELVRRENSLDVELYRFARELFEERCLAFDRIAPDDLEQAAAQRGAREIAPVEGCLRITAERMRGSGLHVEEAPENAPTERWTGGLPVTTLDIAADLPQGAVLTVRLDIARIIRQDVMSTIRVTFDGQTPLQARCEGRASGVEHLTRFRVTPEIAARPMHLLRIHCLSMSPPASPTGETDSRKLGVAIRQIDLSWSGARGVWSRVWSWLSVPLTRFGERRDRAA